MIEMVSNVFSSVNMYKDVNPYVSNVASNVNMYRIFNFKIYT